MVQKEWSFKITFNFSIFPQPKIQTSWFTDQVLIYCVLSQAWKYAQCLGTSAGCRKDFFKRNANLPIQYSSTNTEGMHRTGSN